MSLTNLCGANAIFAMFILIFFVPGSAESSISSCSKGGQRNSCRRTVASSGTVFIQRNSIPPKKIVTDEQIDDGKPVSFVVGRNTLEDPSSTYSPVGTNMRCHPRLRNGLWGDLGSADTDEACQDLCSQEPDCKFVARHQRNGLCSSFFACDQHQSVSDHVTYEKMSEEAATPSPTYVASRPTPRPTPETTPVLTPEPPNPTPIPTSRPTPKPTQPSTPTPEATIKPTPMPSPEPLPTPPGLAPIPPGKENSVCRARPTSRKAGPSYIYNRAGNNDGLCRKPNGRHVANFKYGETCHYTCNSGLTPVPFTGEGLWITCLGDDMWGDIKTGRVDEWNGGGCSQADEFDRYYQTLPRPTFEERVCNNPAQAEEPTKVDSIERSTARGKEWSEAEKREVKQLLFDKFYDLRGRNVFDDSSPTAARILRLGFHDCVKSEDGSGGCDGCIDMKDIDFRIPGNGRSDAGIRKDKPAFLNGNRGLEGAVAWIEKEIFTKRLSNGMSLQQGGKSRADLWAFATIVAIEFTTGVNNGHCLNPDWHKGHQKVVCLQDEAPGCMVTLPRDFVFKTGRRDCQTNLSPSYSAKKRDALPSADMSGSQLTAWFKKWFHFTGRETVAIMGAHTVGNFHNEVTGYWYTYTTQAEDAFNNQYYRNLAAFDEYFIESGGDGQGPQKYSCQKSGTADGHRAKSWWRMKAQAAFTNYAPIQWIQYKQVCANCNWAEYNRWPSSFTQGEQSYVKEACNAYKECQRDGSCEKRDTDLEAENIMQCKAGTEYERFVWGRDEAATHADMGMYYDFLVDKDGFPYGCEKLDKDTGDLSPHGSNFAKGTWDYLHKRTNFNMDHGCGLQKHAEPCGSKPLHELVEEFAEDKSAWLEVFVPTLEKMLENGYGDGELRANGGVNHLQVMGDAGKDYWMKITMS